MVQTYAAGAPQGDRGPFLGALSIAPLKAIARYTSENATVSSVITLTENTTVVEVTAQGVPAVIRWIATSDTEASVIGIAGGTSNYDHVVPVNSARRFVVPIESQANVATGATITSMVGANREFGLFRRVAWKSQGIGSVLMTEHGKSNSY